jgi:hypothetical protein
MSRWNYRWNLVLFAVALALAGCGKGDSIADIAKEACACKDKACGEAVNKKLDAALEKLTSEKEVEKIAGDMGKAGECLARLGVSAK